MSGARKKDSGEEDTAMNHAKPRMLWMSCAEEIARCLPRAQDDIPELGPDEKCPVCGNTRELDPEDLEG